MQDIAAAAWAVLWAEWAVRWSLILGLGGLPWLVEKLVRPRLARHWPHPSKFALFRQTCAFAAFALAVWSFQLAYDTFLVESGNLAELHTKSCTSTEGAQLARAAVRCADGSEYEGVAASVGGSEEGTLYLLPKSGLPVFFRP